MVVLLSSAFIHLSPKKVVKISAPDLQSCFRIISHKMTDKAFCPFYNVGYCKNKDKCSNEHAQDDYEDRKCTNKLCHKRHQKSCKNGLECQFNAKNM